MPTLPLRHTYGEASVEGEFASLGGTQTQVMPALATAAMMASEGVLSALLLDGFSGLGLVADGFMSFQASRYFSNEERFDPGLTHITFRRSMTTAGKNIPGILGKYVGHEKINFIR